MQNDNLLVDAFLLERSEDAFSQLYRHKTPALYQMALRLTSRKNDAEELVQRTWIVAIEKLHNFQKKSTLKTWLTGILINVFREHVRQDTKLKKTSDESVLDSKTVTQPSLEALDLENAIQTLTPGYKEVLILHDVEGYTHKEIGKMLGIVEGTSKSQLFQARKIIREYLFQDHKNR